MASIAVSQGCGQLGAVQHFKYALRPSTATGMMKEEEAVTGVAVTGCILLQGRGFCL